MLQPQPPRPQPPPPQPPPQQPPPGDAVPHAMLHLQLPLGEVAGEGTSGTVSPINDAIDGGRYVVKRSKAPGPESRASLENEIRIHKRLSAECSEVVRYVFASQTAEEVVVLMEACDTVLWEALTRGGGWAALASGPPEQRDRQAWALQLSRAVQHCHSLRVLHRDVNPWNVFLVRGGDGATSARLGDFGLAVQLPEDGSASAQLSGTGAQAGAAALDESALGSLYSAPELGGDSYGFPADVFSLGMTLLALWASVDCDCGEDALIEVTEGVKQNAVKAADPELPALVAAAPGHRRLLRAMVAGAPEARPSASAAHDALTGREDPVRKAGGVHGSKASCSCSLM